MFLFTKRKQTIKSLPGSKSDELLFFQREIYFKFSVRIYLYLYNSQ